MKVEQNVNIHNRFDIEVKNIKTGKIREYVAHNIILNQMWNRLCSGDSYFNNIHFGTGLGTPVASRTGLFTHLGTKSAENEELVKAVPLSTWKRRIVLNPEEYIDKTITEVGIAFDSGSTSLVTHAMLKDSEGNTISITKTGTDVVTIYATVFVTLNTLQNDLTYLRLPNNNQLINYLVGGGSAPSGVFGLSELPYAYSRLGSSPSAIWSSDIPNKQRKTNVVRFGINVGNGNVKGLDFTNLFILELPSNGIFSGQGYVNVPIGVGDGVKKEFNIPSANVRQSSIQIKVDGVLNNLHSKTNFYNNAVRLVDPASLPAGDGRGVALTPDGLVMAVAHMNSPYITTYDWVDGAWVKRPNPASLPTGTGYGVALTPDGLVMAVAHMNSPYITTYDWVGGAWVKRPNPASLPPGNDGYGVALTPDGLVMAVAHMSSPYITTYDWVDGAWVKRPNPASLPANTGLGVALTPDGMAMAVAHSNSPRITTYDWVGGAWVKRPNPASLPPGNDGYGVALTPDGLVMAVAHNGSPYITTYEHLPFTAIKFDTPPAVGEVITADYTVDGIHKTDQYVVDVSFAIQFGEGV